MLVCSGPPHRGADARRAGLRREELRLGCTEGAGTSIQFDSGCALNSAKCRSVGAVDGADATSTGS